MMVSQRESELQEELTQALKERDGARDTGVMQARTIGDQAKTITALRLELTALEAWRTEASLCRDLHGGFDTLVQVTSQFAQLVGILAESVKREGVTVDPRIRDMIKIIGDEAAKIAVLGGTDAKAGT